VNELVLLVCREVRLDEAVVLLPLPPAILPNCSGVSSFFGSLMLSAFPMLLVFCFLSDINIALVWTLEGSSTRLASIPTVASPVLEKHSIIGPNRERPRLRQSVPLRENPSIYAGFHRPICSSSSGFAAFKMVVK